ncbi:MAG TPA: FHA domain-containing protein [Ktedonobacteraceae bacterium]|nr:FHA domain-containing protein [Ktedonobacteraceae bacterium]
MRTEGEKRERELGQINRREVRVSENLHSDRPTILELGNQKARAIIIPHSKTEGVQPSLTLFFADGSTNYTVFEKEKITIGGLSDDIVLSKDPSQAEQAHITYKKEGNRFLLQKSDPNFPVFTENLLKIPEKSGSESKVVPVHEWRYTQQYATSGLPYFSLGGDTHMWLTPEEGGWTLHAYTTGSEQYIEKHLDYVSAVTIGRENCDISLPKDLKVSRNHATLLIDTNSIFIHDNGSRNGTTGELISAQDLPHLPKVTQASQTGDASLHISPEDAKKHQEYKKREAEYQEYMEKQPKNNPFDPYFILGVDLRMSKQEIQGEFRKLARQYHPDANMNTPGSTFVKVASAWETIKRMHGW